MMNLQLVESHQIHIIQGMNPLQFFICLLLLSVTNLRGQDDTASTNYRPDRCELLPLPEHQVSFRIDGIEKTRWHFGGEYPRPFFYPFNGPSGVSLTRMGHPGAHNHEHHRSIWFAHHKLAGSNFWGDGTGTKIRQKMWYGYHDGYGESLMGALLEYVNEEDIVVAQQNVVAAMIPMKEGEYALEIQLTIRPPGKRDSVELEKTNFGFLAVRVSKTLSHHFGGGQLTNSEGAVGEPEIFGKKARWMDYSGPVVMGDGPDRETVTEGITYFDHPSNPRYPSPWHVRSDGWMGASFCMHEGQVVTHEAPLTLRYLLHSHSGDYEAGRAESVAEAFAARPGFEIGKRGSPHRQWEVWRKEE